MSAWAILSGPLGARRSDDLSDGRDQITVHERFRTERVDFLVGLEHQSRLGEVRADERKIRQVTLNLLSNAIKFTPEGGRIEVRAVPVDGSVEAIGPIPTTWREQYDRLRRYWDRLHAPGNVDEHRRNDYYSFFVTCFHLKDWIKNDPTVPQATRDKVETFVGTRQSLRVCADIANGVKHLGLTNAKLVRFDPDTRLSIGPEASGGVAIIAVGIAWDAETVAGRCVFYWVNFLQQEGLLTEPGTDSD